MRVNVSYDSAASRLNIVSQAEDGDNPSGNYHGDDVFFDLPAEVNDLHPDLVALVVILTLHPFIGSRLSINIQASARFASACEDWLSYTCEFSEGAGSVEPRSAGSFPGLSFSGGVDSVAALALMPRDTRAVFLDRVQDSSAGRPSLYNKDSALAACRQIEELGYVVHKVPTSMEYVRRPVGFPVDWSCGAPAILLADYLDLHSVAWGMVAESGYRVGSEGFIDFRTRAIYRRWDALMRAVGLQLSTPVAGVSEVGTSIIERRSHLAGVGQSCIRGPKNEPCKNCKKCVRKLLLDAVLDGRRMEAMDIEKLLRFAGWEKILLAEPIKHEDVFRWTVPQLKVEGRSAALSAFADRLSVGRLDPSWCDTWYEPSKALIPEEYRETSVMEVKRYLRAQSPSETASFEAWEMKSVVQMGAFAKKQARLKEVLLQTPGTSKRRWYSFGR